MCKPWAKHLKADEMIPQRRTSSARRIFFDAWYHEYFIIISNNTSLHKKAGRERAERTSHV